MGYICEYRKKFHRFFLYDYDILFKKSYNLTFNIIVIYDGILF